MPMQPTMVRENEVDGEATMLTTRLSWMKRRGSTTECQLGIRLLGVVIVTAVVEEVGEELEQLDEDLVQ